LNLYPGRIIENRPPLNLYQVKCYHAVWIFVKNISKGSIR